MANLSITRIGDGVERVLTVGRAMHALGNVSEADSLTLNDGVNIALDARLVAEMAEPREQVLRLLAHLMIDHPHNSMQNHPGADRTIPRFEEGGDLRGFLERIGVSGDTDKLVDVQLAEVVRDFWEQLDGVDSYLVSKVSSLDAENLPTQLTNLLVAHLIPHDPEQVELTASVEAVGDPELATGAIGAVDEETGQLPSVEEVGGASMTFGVHGAGRTGAIAVDTLFGCELQPVAEELQAGRRDGLEVEVPRGDGADKIGRTVTAPVVSEDPAVKSPVGEDRMGFEPLSGETLGGGQGVVDEEEDNFFDDFDGEPEDHD